jgi:hypothetical protein
MMHDEPLRGTLSEKALARVSGPGWATLRTAFIRISECLLSPSPEAYGDLTTIYVKYTLSKMPSSMVYAVVWVKSASRLTVGLALPDEIDSDWFITAPKGMTYRGLTKYFVVEKDAEVPKELAEWSIMAHRHILMQNEQLR